MKISHIEHEKPSFARCQAAAYVDRAAAVADMRRTHMSTISLRSSHATLAALRPAGAPSLQARLGGLVDLLLTWQQRARERRQLLGLNDQMLRDIGIGRAEVEAETSKPFWRA
jgi:uncharacterized protein YjiS (DUF1127 family)